MEFERYQEDIKLCNPFVDNGTKLGLSNLEVLDLSWNDFSDGSILLLVGKLSHLRTLSLGNLNGSIDIRGKTTSIHSSPTCSN